MSLDLGLIPLAFLMWIATYPSRALPMLAPGLERMPKWASDYLRLAGPSALAALAAVNCLLAPERPHQLILGIGPVAVAICVVVVWRTRMLFPGILAAVVLVAVTRAAGLG